MGRDGAYTLATDANGNRAIPSLQFWDAVKQNLDDKIGAARRAGEKGHAADLTALNAQLKAHLDAAVPSYADARAGAAAFFGAQDALEAGQKFRTARGKNAQYTRALSSMSPPERQLFARGYASELADRVLELRDNQTWSPSSTSTRRQEGTEASWRWGGTRQTSSKHGCGRNRQPMPCAPQWAIPPPRASSRKWD